MAGTSSQSASSLITLPTAGGGIRGMGEKFTPDLHTGTGNFTVPITLPPGRNGFGPELSLVYSTGSGNGPYGQGWSLSVPGVVRRTDRGVPRYDATDVFVLSGTEDLVPVGPGRFRPRTEELFALIEHRDAGTDDVWVVRGKDGLISTYGTPGATGTDPATIADPDNPSRVFAWWLTRTVDPFGNHIEYRYDAEVGNEPPHRWSQTYLSEMRYADHGDLANPRFLVTVRFAYEQRPDPFSEHRAGFEIRTVRRCVGIKVFTDAGGEQLVRSYQFGYSTNGHNGVSLLRRVEVVGHDGGRTESLPPLEFGYTTFQPHDRRFFPLTGPELPTSSVTAPGFDLVDVTGDGLPDVLELGEVARYWRNLGAGRFDRPRTIPQAPAGIRLGQPGVQLLDADGDGRLDLMVTQPGLSGYFPMCFDGLFDRRSFQRYEVAPSVDLTDPEVRLIDLTGDGVTDALRTGSRLEGFFNDPKRGWTTTKQVARRALVEFPNVSFSDPRVKLADLSGDGLTDIVYVTDSSVSYWPNRGHGDWGWRIWMGNSPRLPANHDPSRVLLGDVDGDGLDDLVYVDDRKITLCINRGGDRWSDPIEIHGTPRVNERVSVQLADVLGTGVSGLLWSSEDTGLGRPHLFFLDFTAGVKPYLLSTMNNNMGAITRVSYTPSTRFAVADARHPSTRWRTPLPFPVQVVARVEAVDELSGGRLTTEYAYHHGFWDGIEREFRGVGRVDQRDTEVIDGEFFSPPTETRTWFHHGAPGDDLDGPREADYDEEYWPDDPPALPGTSLPDGLTAAERRDALRTLRGNVLRTELYALDGTERADRPFTVTEFSHGVRREGDGVFFPHKLAERITQWERGDDPQTLLTFTDGYDQFGFPGGQTVIAVPRGRNYRVPAAAAPPYLVTRTETSYAHRADAIMYLLGRVARTQGFEIVNDGTDSARDLAEAIDAGLAPRTVIADTLHFYDGAPFQGLPLGQLGAHGVLARTETLVLTPEVVAAAYGEQVPFYFQPGAVPGGEYPAEFTEKLPALAGYVLREGRYYAVSAQNRYDCQDDGAGRGLLLATRDPLGRETTIAYDGFELLPVEVTDPAGLTTRAIYDYRVLQPCEITDSNGNRTAAAFTPLGLLASTAVMGKANETAGDTLAVPGAQLIYDFLAFAERRQPVSVRTIRRVHHVNESDVLLPERDDTIETVEYSDGFGRLIQTRTQAEDIVFGDPIFGHAVFPADQTDTQGTKADVTGQQRAAGDPLRVVVSGWQIYDNKGRVAEKYEPFFSIGLDYAEPLDAEYGQKAIMFYDPRGQVIRTVNPDGSEQRVVFGVPEDLANPDRYAPTPWEAYPYDANDNAQRTHGTGDPTHWNTPASIVVDALGRMVTAIARNGPNPDTEWFITHSSYDIRGNLLTVTDALGRLAFRHAYDLANRPLRIENIDAGIRRSVLDAAGNVVEQRDSKGALVLHAYDVLNRPIRLWARDGAGQALTLCKRMVYGDAADSGLATVQAATANLLGKPYQHYDEAGLLTFEAYDFKGNVLEKLRQVIGDAAILAVFNPPPQNWQVPAFRVDWQPASGTTLETYANGLLDASPYRTSVTYDALDRIKTMRYPQDVDGERKEMRPRYNRAGVLERVELDGTTYVEHIAYNAKGQRVLIAYGNGVMTRYAYDPHTFRLVRLRTERYTKSNALTCHPTGTPLQDFAYNYDLVGNITAIRDRTPESGVPNTSLGVNALNRTFTYDPLYRLLSATGRECDVPPPEPWDNRPRSTDLTRARMYAERYRYDPEGNLLLLQHQTSSGGFTRNLALIPNGNRLATMTIGETVYDYAYDSNGNLIRETTSRHFEWDHSDRMRVFRTQTGNAEPSVHAHYLYDASGQRVKKLVRKQGGQVETTVYIDGVFEQQRIVAGSAITENNTLHVVDDQSRIALVRIGAVFSDDTTPAVKFHLGDHLGSSNVVIDDTGAFINREEYTPYGEISFGSFARKRYRFTGKERDEESGLNYHDARYYAPWLGRWLSCDPAGSGDGTNLYAYARENPLTAVDPDGRQSKPATKEKEKPQATGTKSAKSVSPSLTGKETRSKKVTGEGTTLRGEDSSSVGSKKSSGRVEIREGVPLADKKTGSATRDPTFAILFSGPEADKVRALQFQWKEALFVGRNGEPFEQYGTFKVGDGEEQTTMYGEQPYVYVDTASKTDPFYDAKYAAHRGSDLFAIFDAPSAGDFGKEKYAENGAPFTVITWHFDTYLVMGDEVFYHVSWEAEAYYFEGVKSGHTTYRLLDAGPASSGLSPEHKDVLNTTPAYRGKVR